MAAVNDSMSLLKNYNSDESDDEKVPQPKNPAKRSSTEDSSSDQNKKKCSESRLPVPSSLSAMYANEDKEHVDKPSLHQGRIRSFSHERGNWSTHVYVPCGEIEPIDEWTKIIDFIRDWEFEPGQRLNVIENPHVSLSRTVVLRHHWIDSFVSELRERYAQVNAFPTYLSNFEVLLNDEKTRTFLTVSVYKSTHHFADMSEIADNALAEFKLPPFYQRASYHASIAWCLGDQKEALENAVDNDLLEMSQLWIMHAYEVHCKTGNKVHTFPMRYT